jgi:hypothetical protein
LIKGHRSDIWQSSSAATPAAQEKIMDVSNQHQPAPQPEAGQLDYLLRRAEQETIAAMRTVDARASASHAQMASAYGAQVLSLLQQSSPRD